MSYTQLPEGLREAFIYYRSNTTPKGRVLDGDRLCIKAEITDDAGQLIATGTAMLRPDEPCNFTIGHEVALGRARKDVVGKFYSVEVEDSGIRSDQDAVGQTLPDDRHSLIP